MDKQYDPTVFAAMQEGKPFATYKKTVISKVAVTVLDPFSGAPTAIILEGRPGDDKAIISVWSSVEDLFFKRQNRRHFDSGLLIKHEVKEEEKVAVPLEQASDEDLRFIVNQKFLALQNALNKTQSEALVSRFLTIAREEEKSEKIIRVIETRLAELQSLAIQEPKE